MTEKPAVDIKLLDEALRKVLAYKPKPRRKQKPDPSPGP